MRAVLMAGGSGTRLRPLTCDLPKPMVPILNRPIAEHIINLLRKHDITEIITTLHYLPDVMRDYFQDGSDFGVKITYAVEEDQPLGTAGCVKNIAEWLDDTFLVISGDSITDFAINSDKIDLLTQAGNAISAPSNFSRAANSTVTTLQNLVNQVFTDANGAITGNQGLAVNSAALVQVTTGAIAGTYLVINDSTAGFQSSNDLLINITGFTGTLPALGNIPVSNFFV